LGVLGEAQLLVIGDGEQVAQVDAGGGGASITEVRDFSIDEQVGAHAGLLRALAGIDERYFRGYAVLMTSRPL